MAEPEATSKAESKVAHQNEAGPRVNTANAVEQDSNVYEINLPIADGRGSSECKARVMERTEERWSSFTHGQHMDKESNAGFGTLSYLPLETRRMIYDFLLFDQCTEHEHTNIFTNASNHSGDPIEFYVWADLEHEAGIFDFKIPQYQLRESMLYIQKSTPPTYILKPKK